MRRISILTLGLVLTVCLGCTDTAVVEPDGEIVLRFVEDDPQIELASSPDSRMEAVFEWHWDGRTSPERWQPVQTRLQIPRRGGLMVWIEGDEPALETDVDLRAGEVQVIEIRVRGLGRRSLELAWSTSGRDFTQPEQRIPATEIESHEGALIYRYSLAGNPGWTGDITALRLEIPGENLERFRIHSVSGLQRVVVPGWASMVAASPHKIDLDHDTRNALVAPPGFDHSRRLRIPPGATFSFAFGLQEDVGTPVTFTVEIDGSNGRSSTVFSSSIGSGSGPSVGKWHEAVLDLGEFADDDATIRLLTSSDEDFDPQEGLPAWANPEVVAPGPSDEPPNVIFICLDTLRADGLSSYGNPLPTSPRIDAWAADRGVRFKNSVAAAPWTLPSHTTMFTGLDAVRHGVNFASAAPPELEMIAERMRRAGYTTGAFTGGGYLGDSFGFIQGFDDFAYWPGRHSADELKWVTEQTLEWLESNRQRPFFLFVHTYEVHYPHRRRQPFFNRFAQLEGADPPEGAVQMRAKGWSDLIAEGDVFVIRRPGSKEWVGPLTDDETQMVRLMYHSAVAYADTKVGMILDKLAELEIDEKTMVILTSDHGEALGEDGLAGHYYLDDFNVMVPLIIEFPGGAHAGATIDRQVRSTDLVPTILEAVGLAVPPDLDGRSLVPVVEGAAADHPAHAWSYAGSSNRGLGLRIDNSVKYIYPDAAWARLGDREAVYDLETDPREKTNLIDSHPRTDEFRETTKTTILEQHVGYRLVISNEDLSTIAGRLTGRWSMHDRVKIADHSCDCVRWHEKDRATFSLARGQRVELLFGELKGFDVGIEGRLEAPGVRTNADFDLDFQLDGLELPAAIEFTNRGWQMVEGADSPPENGFFITVAGDRVPGSDAAPPPDEATLEQLRALGYVE